MSSLIPQGSINASIAASISTATLLQPLDYYKTILQLTYGKSPLNIPAQPKYLFSGLSAVNLSIFVKSFVRFQTFNYCNEKLLKLGNEDTNNPGLLISSLIAGVAESIAIVPFENVKVNMIESSLYNTPDAKPNPFGIPQAKKFKNIVKKHNLDNKGISKANQDFLEVAPLSRKVIEQDNLKKTSSISKNVFKSVQLIYKNRGLYGFFKGMNVTILRQCSNSIGFFSSYMLFKQLVDPNNKNSDSNYLKFGLSLMSSIFIVMLNQPLDVIKSRFQSELYNNSGSVKCKNSLECAFRIYVEEGGFKKLYAGWFPRLIKISMSGSLMMIFVNYFETML